MLVYNTSTADKHLPCACI